MSVPGGRSHVDDAPVMTHRAPSARTAWLAGALLGAFAGFLVLEGGIMGVALLLAATILIHRTGAGLFGLGGMLTGFGGLWGALLGRVKIACSPATSCAAPTIDWWLLIAATVLALGLGVTIVAARRHAR